MNNQANAQPHRRVAVAACGVVLCGAVAGSCGPCGGGGGGGWWGGRGQWCSVVGVVNHHRLQPYHNAEHHLVINNERIETKARTVVCRPPTPATTITGRRIIMVVRTCLPPSAHQRLKWFTRINDNWRRSRFEQSHRSTAYARHGRKRYRGAEELVHAAKRPRTAM